jgi:hypothetical protein
MDYILKDLSEKIKNEVSGIKVGTNVRIVEEPCVKIDDRKYIVIYLCGEDPQTFDDMANQIIDVVKEYNEELISSFYIYNANDTTKHEYYADSRKLDYKIN